MDVEGLGLAPVGIEPQPPVGQGAVDVEADQPDAGGAGEEVDRGAKVAVAHGVRFEEGVALGREEATVIRGHAERVVGGDRVAGGRDDASEIQRAWRRGAEIWQRLRFAFLTRGGSGMSVEDLPPRSELVDVSDLVGSGTEIRRQTLGREGDELILRNFEGGIYRYTDPDGTLGAEKPLRLAAE